MPVNWRREETKVMQMTLFINAAKALTETATGREASNSKRNFNLPHKYGSKSKSNDCSRFLFLEEADKVKKNVCRAVLKVQGPCWGFPAEQYC